MTASHDIGNQAPTGPRAGPSGGDGATPPVGGGGTPPGGGGGTPPGGDGGAPPGEKNELARRSVTGFEAHRCLGEHLARLELRVLLQELLPVLPQLQPDGEPVRIRSNFTNGLKRLPVRIS